MSNTSSPVMMSSTSQPVMTNQSPSATVATATTLGRSCAATYPQSDGMKSSYDGYYASLGQYNTHLDGYVYGPPIAVSSTAVVSAITPVWGGVAFKKENFIGALGSSYTTLGAAYGGAGGCGANYASLR